MDGLQERAADLIEAIRADIGDDEDIADGFGTAVSRAVSALDAALQSRRRSRRLGRVIDRLMEAGVRVFGDSRFYSDDPIESKRARILLPFGVEDKRSSIRVPFSPEAGLAGCDVVRVRLQYPEVAEIILEAFRSEGYRAEWCGNPSEPIQVFEVNQQ